MVTILHLYSTIKEHSSRLNWQLNKPAVSTVTFACSLAIQRAKLREWLQEAEWPQEHFSLRTRTAQRVKSEHKKPRLVKVDLSRTSFKLKHSKERIRYFYLIVFCIMSQLLVKTTFLFHKWMHKWSSGLPPSGNPLARAERTGDCVDAAQSSLFLKLCTKERTW